MQFPGVDPKTLFTVIITLLGLLSCASCEVSSLGNKASSARQPILRVAEHLSSTPIPSRSLAGVTLAQSDDPPIQVDFADSTGNGPQFYGVEYSWIDQHQDLYLERYRRLHGNVVRVQINQDVFEPINDNDDPDFSEIDWSFTIPVDSESGTSMTYDTMFKALASEFPGMYFQIDIWLAARWNAANPNGYLGIGGAFPPKDYAEHREFIRALANWLVDECGIAPDHLSFAFVNEPNLRGFFVGTQADLARMAEETRGALDQVSSLIRMGGLDEVHGTSWTDEFYRQGTVACCDLWTFHAYNHGLPSLWTALEERTEHLSQYGPVWVTEFADTTYGSPDAQMDFSSAEAALEFAELLGRLWPTAIDGVVHFRLSDTYADIFGGWVGHGLFADARGTHSNGQAYEPFPVYWVFANMYRELGGGQIVRTTAPKGLTVIGVRKDDGADTRLALWVTNSTTQGYETSLTVKHFPAPAVQVQVFDNLAGDTPIETHAANGTEPSFAVSIPSRSSHLLLVTAQKKEFLPLILK